MSVSPGGRLVPKIPIGRRGISIKPPEPVCGSEIDRAVRYTFTGASMTLGEQIKAARAELVTARTTVGIAISASLDASKSVKGEAEKLKAEAAAMLAELAEVTNGGPAIEDHVTPLPVGPAVSYP